jgi:hypothetical protein
MNCSSQCRTPFVGVLSPRFGSTLILRDRVSKGQVDSPVLEIQVKPKLPITRHALAG